MMEKDRDTIDDILSDIKSDHLVQRMKKYIQHGRISTYEHCENVTRMSDKIDKILHLHSDRDTLLKGAMLHDFYLYDWHEEDGGTHKLHGFRHAKAARENARQYLHTNEKINDVIDSHMWPLNLKKVPKSREAWVVCIADKLVSLHETIFRRGRSLSD